jgi:DeoR family ulaG and ulaABCDEF operon transcriptional repressor
LQAEKKLLDRAEQVIVLADSSKFHRRGSLILCPLRRISRIITDDAIDDAALGMLEASGVDVVVAQSIRPRDSAA